MINIHSILSNVAGDLSTDVDFLYGPKEWQNYSADNATLPVMYVNEPITSDDTFTQSGRIIEEYNLEIFFGKQAEPDWTAAQHHTNCVQPMRELANEFILRLLEKRDNVNRELVETIRNIQKSNIQGLFDTYSSGVVVTLRLTPYDYGRVCP